MTITAEQIVERMNKAAFSMKAHEEAQSILDAIRAEATAAAMGVAAQTLETQGDSAATEALGQRLCCNGHHCGCQGSTVEDYLIHLIRALTPADATAWLEADRAAQREAGALPWRKVAMSGTPGGSEYTDPERCAAYLHDTRREMVKAKIENAKLRQDRAAQRKAAITEQLGEATADKESPVWVHGPDGAKGCAYINAHVHARLVREQRKAGADEALAGGVKGFAMVDQQTGEPWVIRFDRREFGGMSLPGKTTAIHECTIIVSKEGV